MPGFIDPSKLINVTLLKELEQEINKSSRYDARIEQLLQCYKERLQRGHII